MKPARQPAPDARKPPSGSGGVEVRLSVQVQSGLRRGVQGRCRAGRGGGQGRHSLLGAPRSGHALWPRAKRRRQEAGQGRRAGPQLALTACTWRLR